MNNDLTLNVTEFVALCNQTLEYAYPNVTVVGELANFRVSKNRWVYFDLKDEACSVKFFGTVYQLPAPLEDGMMVAVKASPRLHPHYGFSLHILSIRPVGEGTIKKAAARLEAKLAAEGLFDTERKRALPHPPDRIGLITSSESAAYRDFMKVLHARWGGLEVALIDVQVQGELAVPQITQAIEQCNQSSHPPDTLVITRGGGSAEDLQVFNTEQVTRAVAGSRIPTLVAVGHEVDVSLAELAADQRASTPSNAAELLVPDRKAALSVLASHKRQLTRSAENAILQPRAELRQRSALLTRHAEQQLGAAAAGLSSRRQLLEAFNPKRVLAKGYALVRANNKVIQSGAQIHVGQQLQLYMSDAHIQATVNRVTIEP